jgi:hypothetical protein
MPRDESAGRAELTELRVDAVYRNTNNWKAPADQFNRFFRFSDGVGINNTSGFRPKSKNGGSTDIVNCAFCVLVTTFGETHWPDRLDRESGEFLYYGDNQKPGKAVNETAVGGNRLLEHVFLNLHSGARSLIPPFLCFESFTGSDGKYMRFLGLAAPGGQGISSLEDLVAVWRVKSGTRFQNYRALFTVLRSETVSHAWLEDLVGGMSPADSPQCPQSWARWAKFGLYDALKCEQQIVPRSRAEQLPQTTREADVLEQILSSLTDREFEFAAAAIVGMMDPRFCDVEVTRAVRDGGRDVIAAYRIGHETHHVSLHACVEAKRWKPGSSVGVKPLMRLISRIKHRDFGVFVTTSFFDRQVQEELLEDRHPVVLVSGGDVARLLISRDLEGPALERWIQEVKVTARPFEG